MAGNCPVTDCLNQIRMDFFLSRDKEALTFLDQLLVKGELKNLFLRLRNEPYSSSLTLHKTMQNISEMFPDEYRGLMYKLILKFRPSDPIILKRYENILMMLAFSQSWESISL